MQEPTSTHYLQTNIINSPIRDRTCGFTSKIQLQLQAVVSIGPHSSIPSTPHSDVPMQIEEAIQFLKLFVCSYALGRSVLDHLDEIRPSWLVEFIRAARVEGFNRTTSNTT